ncbi:S9 family peptidase [Haoranjiania flava]|uniref:Prolyl oligopeptidase family serine peptidase n=1 Tax=Haoranjiania flava TaxID=1856322 RepID=A0AAE3LMW3_9BACT|nr:prolyl oligopeptidase family serine peptidase [Haoranjiania flava]MCU7694331.1 prolyl oligopeptidase family serine peptidase [Haoranjiania flava]
MRFLFFTLAMVISMSAGAQTKFTPEILWKLGRVSGLGLSKDKRYVLYEVSLPDMQDNKINKKTYRIFINGGTPEEVTDKFEFMANDRISPNGHFILSSEEVRLENVMGKDRYEDLDKTTGQVYTSLNYRHWDKYFNGNFSHVFYAPYKDGVAGEKKDIMPGEPFFAPQQPFGGDEDFIWSPDSKNILYVSKKKYGTEYALSTNTDIFSYNLSTGKTTNLTHANKGYDVAPDFGRQGILAWLQMKRDGYEADKQDIVVMHGKNTINLTGHADHIHVDNFKWAEDGRNIFFIAPVDGTLQLFSVNDIGLTKATPVIKQLTKGDFNIKSIIGETGSELVVMKEDFNRAAEIFKVNLATGKLMQLTHVNDDIYKNIVPSQTERRWIKTTDNKRMMEWIVYPPDFDPNKKYPVLLYCEGGPQSALTQFYSFRWNVQVMAAQGYIVLLPSRRGMPGFGTAWNEQISKDWGGQVIDDYLAAIDDLSKEKFVDTGRRGAIGASFGGYSVFKLAGLHNNRFKTFIAHNGVFDFRSMYGTTEEMWFANWELGGPYWQKDDESIQYTYAQSPSNFVDKWNTPIYIIQNEKDYRVPFEQGQQAFQAAQLRGIKSKLLVFPDENHWVLKPQNGLLWQREFFSWLKETL